MSEVTWPEWLEWLAFMELEPFGEEIENFRTALIAQAIWNVQIAKGTKKGKTPRYRELHEFVLRFGDAPDPKPPPKRIPAKAQFESWLDYFEAMGKKPVNRNLDAVGPDVKDGKGKVTTETERG